MPPNLKIKNYHCQLQIMSDLVALIHLQLPQYIKNNIALPHQDPTQADSKSIKYMVNHSPSIGRDNIQDEVGNPLII